MKRVLTAFLVVLLVYTVTFSAFASMSDGEYVFDFSSHSLLVRLDDVAADYVPFPSFPNYEQPDVEDAGFFERIANFFEYVFDFFGWIGNVIKWVFDDLILLFRFIGCFLPVQYSGGDLT